jgi:hypothetical protein
VRVRMWPGLVVVSKEVVQSRDQGSGVDAGVGAVVIVAVQPGVDGPAALARAGIGSGVGPFAQGSLDEALGLAVGARRVGLGAQVAQAGISAGTTEIMLAVGRAVVGHDALDGDAMAVEPGERALEEGDGAGLLLIGQDLAVGKPCGIVDHDVQNLPAAVVARPGAIAAMRWPMPSMRPSFLVSMWSSSPGPARLVADYWRPGLEGRQSAEAEAPQHQADGRAGPLESARDLRPA